MRRVGLWILDLPPYTCWRHSGVQTSSQTLACMPAPLLQCFSSSCICKSWSSSTKCLRVLVWPEMRLDLPSGVDVAEWSKALV